MVICTIIIKRNLVKWLSVAKINRQIDNLVKLNLSALYTEYKAIHMTSCM